MKTIITIVAIALVAGAAYVFFTSDAYAPTPDPTSASVDESMSEGEEKTAEGTVTVLNADHVPVDGPYLVTISTAAEGEMTIAIPSMGINLCAARTSIEDFGNLSVGDRVEVRGSVGVDDYIIPCVSTSHYLRITDPA